MKFAATISIGGWVNEIAHFAVNTRLTRVLGETYRSSEAALKELVDNAWDADANNVWIDLPEPLTDDAVTVRDDGTGMTALEVRGEYLNIASDKRTRTGERTAKFNRKVKGRKGIGKFAGLTIASRMEVVTVARRRRCTLLIDKNELVENPKDLEAVRLPFVEDDVDDVVSGTTVTLTELDSRLNFPTPLIRSGTGESRPRGDPCQGSRPPEGSPSKADPPSSFAAAGVSSQICRGGP
ncbi:hypothetical protein EOA88_19490 [Mesorhizobium sp. M5C.F.Ca.IN.020.14.1.1]|nr:hypothetical protein EOA88_19490 [Mesorhizobium sp. M5C.F.Ca.IN.020.14.1.1]